jgi:hypothetical protein
MTKSSLCSALLGALFVVGLAIAPAHAQATRTWVSGVGDDVNPCSRTAPCKTFAGAISKTAAGGEIDVLDPGGFGAVTITKSISIYNDGVGEAGVLVAGTNGIVISAQTTDAVNLRGLVINGINASGGLAGVLVLQALRVEIMNCVIQEIGTGVSVTPSGGSTVNVKIQDTTIKEAGGGGVISKPTGGATVNMSIDRTRIDNNAGGGVRIDGTGGGSSNVTITDSSMSLNASNGVNGVSGPSGNVNVDLMRDVIAKNGGAGIQSNNTTGGAAVLTVGESMLSNNTTAFSIVNTAQLLSYHNNQVTGATGSTPGTATPQ